MSVPPFLRQHDPDPEDLANMRFGYRIGLYGREPIMLNQGRLEEEPFSVELALAFGERLADEILR